MTKPIEKSAKLWTMAVKTTYFKATELRDGATLKEGRGMGAKRGVESGPKGVARWASNLPQDKRPTSAACHSR